MSAIYAWLRRHPRLVDGLLALVLAFGGLVPAIVSANWLVLLETLGLTVPVIFRRAHPVAAFWFAIAVGAIQVASWSSPVAPDLAIIVLLYTLAAYTTRRKSLIGLAATLAGCAAELGPLYPHAVRYGIVDWVGSGAILMAGPSLLAWVLGDSMRYRRAYYVNLEERATRLERDREVQNQMAAAAERARIARELHDVVAHNVSVMIVQADGAAYALDNDPDRTRQALAAIAATGRQALAEMRVMLGVLRKSDETAPAALSSSVPASSVPASSAPAGSDLAAAAADSARTANGLGTGPAGLGTGPAGHAAVTAATTAAARPAAAAKPPANRAGAPTADLPGPGPAVPRPTFPPATFPPARGAAPGPAPAANGAARPTVRTPARPDLAGVEPRPLAAANEFASQLPELAPMPGIGQLEDLLDQAREVGLAVSCTTEGPVRPLPSGTGLAAYRIVQESLTNTRKHAGLGASASVRLRYLPDAIEVTVTDDGIGAAAPCDGAGHGVTGMRERVALYGGTFAIGPLPGRGFRVLATLPTSPEQAGAA